jgi:hypothetical protein
MATLDIFHSTYKKFYAEMKTSQNYNSKNFINNNLENFTNAVLEDWCGDVFSTGMENGDVTNSDHDILFSVTASHNQRVSKGRVSYVPLKTRVAVLSNGDIAIFEKVVTKSGSQTFTGDVYIDCYKNTYTIKEILYKSELFDDFSILPDITSEQIESIAVEMAQEIIEIHEQKDFNV